MADFTGDGEQMATDLARHLGQVSLDSSSSSPVLPSREHRPASNFRLNELEIQQTIGTPSFYEPNYCKKNGDFTKYYFVLLLIILFC